MPINSTSALPQLFAFVPFILLGFLFYGLIFYCIWKFYQLLSKINDNIARINDNIAGIRRSGLETSERMAGPASSDAAKHNTPQKEVQQCPSCGLRVLPTADGRCPSCQTSLA